MADTDEARRRRGDTDAYHFTLHFRVPDNGPVRGTEALAAFPGGLGPDRLELRPEDGRQLGEARRLSLSGQGYDAEEQAREAGERAREALLLATLESGTGVEWDDGPERGLSIWKGGPRLILRARLDASATATTDVNVDALRDRFGRWLAEDPGLTQRQTTAADLLAAFHFDVSERSRFLVAYAAVEELGADPKELGLEPAERSGPYLAALGKLVEHLDAIEADPDPAADREAKRELRDGLLGLQSVKETGRCKKLIEDVLGPKAVKTFKRLAASRRDVAHRGQPPSEGGLSSEAYYLARDLLFGTIARRHPRTRDGRHTPDDDLPPEAA